MSSSTRTGKSCWPRPAAAHWPPNAPARSLWSSAGRTAPELTDGNGNDWRSSNPPKTKLRECYDLGLRTANLTYQLSNQFGGGMLDPTVPLTVEGRLIVAQMQKLGIVVDVSGHTGVQTALDVIRHGGTSRWSSRTAMCRH